MAIAKWETIQMANKKMTELTQKSDEELRQMLSELTESHFKLRFRKVTDVVENPTEIQELRRKRARILTLLRQRQTQPPARRLNQEAKK